MKVKRIVIIILMTLSILIIMLAFNINSRFCKASSVCERIGDRKQFLRKLEIAEHNKTLARLLFIYYAHKCINLTNEDKEKVLRLER